MMLKNVAGQGMFLLAVDTTVTPPSGKTGDAANITGSVSLDGAAATGFATAHPTEIGGGLYWQPISQAGTNGNVLGMYWSSGTAGVRIDPVVVFTSGVNLPVAAYASSAGLPTCGTGQYQIALAANGVVTVGTNNDKTGYALSAAGLDTIVVETGCNLSQAVAEIAAVTCGASTGVDTGLPVYKGIGVGTTRLTCSASGGNRSSVVMTLPSI